MQVPSMTPELAAAYVHCRAVAKREAKNFYYGFMALPSLKRDAMCAVYAFMRRADDLSDDESISMEDRRVMMAAWLESWRTNQNVEAQDVPVFLAVHDVQARYGVEDSLLEQLVQGTTMDLDPKVPAGVRRITVDGRTIDQYESIGSLERYCYLVASVVGLTTIRIFGFTDPQANSYAEQLGLAFQLTNILRDVKEDAERGRIYLPMDLLSKYGLNSADVLRMTASGETSAAMKALLAEMAARAETYYRADKKLIPLLDADSRPAMRVLIDIYHLLLLRIVANGYRVLAVRESVPTARKLAVLMKGMIGGMLSRGGKA